MCIILSNERHGACVIATVFKRLHICKTDFCKDLSADMHEANNYPDQRSLVCNAWWTHR